MKRNRRKGLLPDDPKYSRQCFWKEAGERCQRMGVYSPSLHGHGPHFCAEHGERMLGRRPAPSEADLPVDDRVNDIVPRHEGESMHDWSMRCREHVLTKAGLRTMREPGQDG